MILASEPGHLLWSDDYVLAECARAQYGVRRVWTQVVLQARAKQGAVEPSVFAGATAKLAGYGYSFTSLNTPSLMRAGELAKWNPAAWPLKQVLRQFGAETIALLDTGRLIAEFIVQLYREDLFADHRIGSANRDIGESRGEKRRNRRCPTDGEVAATRLRLKCCSRPGGGSGHRGVAEAKASREPMSLAASYSRIRGDTPLADSMLESRHWVSQSWLGYPH